MYSAAPTAWWASRLLTEQWDGATWTPSPSSEFLIEYDETMSGVSCTSATICMVTGAYTRYFGASVVATETLAEQVNGSDWTVVCDSCGGSQSGRHPRLDAVSCTSDTYCVAVGATSRTKSSFDPPKTLAAQWNGTSWSLTAVPNPAGAAASELVGVSCATSTSCIAVGDYQVAATGETRPLTELWNGTTWSIVTAPVS